MIYLILEYTKITEFWKVVIWGIELSVVSWEVVSREVETLRALRGSGGDDSE